MRREEGQERLGGASRETRGQRNEELKGEEGRGGEKGVTRVTGRGGEKRRELGERRE